MVTVRSVVELSVTVDYSLYERASLLIDAAGAKQAAPQFTDRVTLCWQMPEHTEGPLLEQLRELTRGGAQVPCLGTVSTHRSDKNCVHKRTFEKAGIILRTDRLFPPSTKRVCYNCRGRSNWDRLCRSREGEC